MSWSARWVSASKLASLACLHSARFLISKSCCSTAFKGSPPLIGAGDGDGLVKEVGEAAANRFSAFFVLITCGKLVVGVLVDSVPLLLFEEPFVADTVVGVIIDGVGVEVFIGDGADGNADVENPLLVPLVVVEDEECEAISDSNRRSLSEKFKFSGGSGLSIGITFGFGFGATGGGPPGRLLLFIDVNVVAAVAAGDEG